MSRDAVILVGIAAAGIGIALIARKAVAEPCVDMEPDIPAYFTYVGARKPFIAALGECYSVIDTIDVWSDLYQEWLAPVDPRHDKIEPGSLCRIIVQWPCRLCGFEPLFQPPAELSSVGLCTLC